MELEQAILWAERLKPLLFLPGVGFSIPVILGFFREPYASPFVQTLFIVLAQYYLFEGIDFRKFKNDLHEHKEEELDMLIKWSNLEDMQRIREAITPLYGELLTLISAHLSQEEFSKIITTLSTITLEDITEEGNTPESRRRLA